MRRLALGLLILVSLAIPAQAGWTNDPLTFQLDQRKIYQPVDHETWCGDCTFIDYTAQEPWVINPTSCMWDTDDEFRYVNAGNVIESGATATIGECLYKGNQLVRASTRIFSPSPSLVVTYAFTSDAGTEAFVIPAVFNPASHRWDYNGCIAPLLQGGTEVEVPGSHGGTAVPWAVTVSVTNPTSQKIAKTGGSLSFGWLPYFGSC